MSKPIDINDQPGVDPTPSTEDISASVSRILGNLESNDPQEESINQGVSEENAEALSDFKFAPEEGAETEEAEDAIEVEEEASEDEAETQADSEVDSTLDETFTGKVVGEDGEVTEVEIPKDLILTVKVDGEEQEMSLQEIKNGISGEKALSKRFSALDQQRRELEDNQGKWQELQSGVLQKMAEGDHIEALGMIFGQTGYDTETALAGIIVELLPIFENLQELSDVERSDWIYNVDKAQKSELLKQKDNELNKLRTENTQKSQLDSLKSEKGMTESQIRDAYGQLLNGIDNRTLDLKKESISVEHLSMMHDHLQRESWLQTAFADVDLSPSEKEDAITQKYKEVMALQNAGIVYDADKVLKEVQSAHETKKNEALKEKSKKVSQVLQKKGHKKISGETTEGATTEPLREHEKHLGFSLKNVAKKLGKNDNFLF